MAGKPVVEFKPFAQWHGTSKGAVASYATDVVLCSDGAAVDHGGPRH